MISRRILLSSAGLGMASLSLTACDLNHIVGQLAPKESTSKRLMADIAYGPNPRHRYDVYAPVDAKRPLPLIIFFYGGGWHAGDKQLYAFAGRALSALGYVVAIADYRLYPEVRFPDFLIDCANAVRHITAHAVLYGADPKRLCVMGHSAGAYNAAMLTFDAQWLKGEPRIKTFVGISGPYDFYPFDVDASKNTFGTWPHPEQTQPIQLIGPVDTKTLIIQSRDDDVVGVHNSVNLEKKLSAAHNNVTLKLYDHVTHQDMVAALSIPFRDKAKTLADIQSFLATNL